MGGEQLEVTEEERDIGVNMTSSEAVPAVQKGGQNCPDST
jgi:hypothetical protein